MSAIETNKIRNVALVGHGGSGKTSLTAALLFQTGAVNRLGKVDDGTAPTDFDTSEVNRKISINNGLGSCQWKGIKLNLLDTPGYGDFIYHSKLALRVADAAIVTVCGVSGVEVFTDKAWEFCDEFGLPRAVFINKLERERASFQRTLKDVEDHFGKRFIPLTLPIGQEAGFKGLVDLVHLKAYEYESNGSGKGKEVPLPAGLEEDIQNYREKLVEAAAETDDVLIEKFLEGDVLTEVEIFSGIAKGFKTGSFVPVLCGSAAQNVGSDLLLETITSFFPSPAEREPVTGRTKADDTGETVHRSHDQAAPFSALVYNTMVDQYAGHISLFRVFSGSIHGETTVQNSTKSEPERFGPLFTLVGKDHVAMTEASAGDIVAVAKLKNTYTGNTLCDPAHPIVFPGFEIPPPLLMSCAIPKTKNDEDKIHGAMHRLMEEDPFIRFDRNAETNEEILSGMGNLHVEVTVERLKEKFHVDCELSVPTIPYRETIKAKATAEGKFKKQTGGRGQFGVAWIDLAPLPRGSGFEFVDNIVGGSIPRNFIPSVEKGIVHTLPRGPLAGFPVVDVQVRLFDGKYHPVDSSDAAFQRAGSMAFKAAYPNCHPVLLEPIYHMEVVVPEESMGDVMGDLNSRRGRVLGMDSKGKNQIIRAQVPLAEILRYAPSLRSMTAGRGYFTMKFDHYDEVPAMLQDKVIAAHKREVEEEED